MNYKILLILLSFFLRVPRISTICIKSSAFNPLASNNSARASICGLSAGGVKGSTGLQRTSSREPHSTGLQLVFNSVFLGLLVVRSVVFAVGLEECRPNMTISSVSRLFDKSQSYQALCKGHFWSSTLFQLVLRLFQALQATRTATIIPRKTPN